MSISLLAHRDEENRVKFDCMCSYSCPIKLILTEQKVKAVKIFKDVAAKKLQIPKKVDAPHTCSTKHGFKVNTQDKRHWRLP